MSFHNAGFSVDLTHRRANTYFSETWWKHSLILATNYIKRIGKVGNKESTKEIKKEKLKKTNRYKIHAGILLKNLLPYYSKVVTVYVFAYF